MAYTNQIVINALKAQALTGTAGTSLYKFTVPTGKRLYLQKVIQRVTTQCNSTSSPGIKILKGSSTVKTCTVVPTTTAVGTVYVDNCSETSSVDMVFEAAEVLEIQVAVQASTACSLDVDLVLGIDN